MSNFGGPIRIGDIPLEQDTFLTVIGEMREDFNVICKKLKLDFPQDLVEFEDDDYLMATSKEFNLPTLEGGNAECFMIFHARRFILHVSSAMRIANGSHPGNIKRLIRDVRGASDSISSLNCLGSIKKIFDAITKNSAARAKAGGMSPLEVEEVKKVILWKANEEIKIRRGRFPDSECLYLNVSDIQRHVGASIDVDLRARGNKRLNKRGSMVEFINRHISSDPFFAEAIHGLIAKKRLIYKVESDDADI